MGKKVYVNGMEVAHKAGDNKVVAAFPDVCLSPPGPPAGPVPVPYPDTSHARDLENGSKDVKVGGQPAALHQHSYYKTSPLGNEAATRNFGASILTATVVGKTYFQASSMNVSFEGKLVNRHLDLATSNHQGDPPGTPPSPGLETMSSAAGGADNDVETPQCPCCHDDAHPNQLGPDGQLSPIVSQDQYYGDKSEYFTSRRGEMQQMLASGKTPAWANQPGVDNNPAFNGLLTKDIIIGKGNASEAMLGELRAVTAANPDCPNLHRPPDVGCGIHFKPNGRAEDARKQFKKIRRRYIAKYRREHPTHTKVRSNSQINHRTPLDAGGCPVSEKNMIPNPVLEGACARIEALQTALQSMK